LRTVYRGLPTGICRRQISIWVRGGFGRERPRRCHIFITSPGHVPPQTLLPCLSGWAEAGILIVAILVYRSLQALDSIVAALRIISRSTYRCGRLGERCFHGLFICNEIGHLWLTRGWQRSGIGEAGVTRSAFEGRVAREGPHAELEDS